MVLSHNLQEELYNLEKKMLKLIPCSADLLTKSVIVMITALSNVLQARATLPMLDCHRERTTTYLMFYVSGWGIRQLLSCDYL